MLKNTHDVSVPVGTYCRRRGGHRSGFRPRCAFASYCSTYYRPVHVQYTFFFFSGTVRRASARPYYDKTQRMPHAQSDRDVSYLAKLTAMVVGKILNKKTCSAHLLQHLQTLVQHVLLFLFGRWRAVGVGC